jgi:hypothetical protein
VSKIIYDVRREPQDGVGENEIHLQTYGNYGSEDWWNALEESDLIRVEEGVISKVFESGHGDNFPEFEIELSNEKFTFERKGDINKYEVGSALRVFMIPLETVINCEHPLAASFAGKFDLIKAEIL